MDNKQLFLTLVTDPDLDFPKNVENAFIKPTYIRLNETGEVFRIKKFYGTVVTFHLNEPFRAEPYHYFIKTGITTEENYTIVKPNKTT